jgi:hypothetical protein
LLQIHVFLRFWSYLNCFHLPSFLANLHRSLGCRKFHFMEMAPKQFEMDTSQDGNRSRLLVNYLIPVFKSYQRFYFTDAAINDVCILRTKCFLGVALQHSPRSCVETSHLYKKVVLYAHNSYRRTCSLVSVLRCTDLDEIIPRLPHARRRKSKFNGTGLWTVIKINRRSIGGADESCCTRVPNACMCG